MIWTRELRDQLVAQLRRRRRQGHVTYPASTEPMTTEGDAGEQARTDRTPLPEHREP